MGVEITEVRSRPELKDWVTFPNRLYRDDPRYIPQLIGQELEFFTRSSEPVVQGRPGPAAVGPPRRPHGRTRVRRHP